MSFRVRNDKRHFRRRTAGAAQCYRDQLSVDAHVNEPYKRTLRQTRSVTPSVGCTYDECHGCQIRTYGSRSIDRFVACKKSGFDALIDLISLLVYLSESISMTIFCQMRRKRCKFYGRIKNIQHFFLILNFRRFYKNFITISLSVCKLEKHSWRLRFC